MVNRYPAHTRGVGQRHVRSAHPGVINHVCTPGYSPWGGGFGTGVPKHIEPLVASIRRGLVGLLLGIIPYYSPVQMGHS
jgi:hypothetical protein